MNSKNNGKYHFSHQETQKLFTHRHHEALALSRFSSYHPLMALTYSEKTPLGSIAPDFSLPGTDGKTHGLSDFRSHRAIVIIFMCNHCPYVQAVQGRINALAKEFQAQGVAVIGINSNDSVQYPEDSFEAMKQTAAENGYIFPYLWDESQKIAQAYGAVCTPDFYLYENTAPNEASGSFSLKYRGRLDDSWKNEKAVTRRDLALAIQAVLNHQPIPEEIPSMGCSIKWK